MPKYNEDEIFDLADEYANEKAKERAADKNKNRFILTLIVLPVLAAIAIIAGLSIQEGYFIFFPPTNLLLRGEETTKVNAFSLYVDSGAYLQKGNKILDAQIEVSGEVDTNKLGEYQVVYTAEINGKTYTAHRKVAVVDGDGPVVTLNGESEVNCPNPADFEDPGATALDKVDGNVTSTLTAESKEVEGGVLITYTATDKSGNKGEATRMVWARDNVPPVITVTGISQSYIAKGSEFVDAGATAFDEADGDVSASITVSGKVDTSTLGTYVLTYTAEDSFGNKSTAERSVTVYEANNDGKYRIYLTFDDGPSHNVTPRVLNLLKKYNAKATFFIINYDDYHKQFIQRMIDEGHTVAIHGYSHDYSKIYKSEDAFMENIYALQNKLMADFGYSSKIIRFPGGSSNEVSIKYNKGVTTRIAERLTAEGYIYHDWNVASVDAAGGVQTPEEIYESIVYYLRKDRNNIVLCHDAMAKSTTADALEAVLQYGEAHGYTFLPITENTAPVHHGIRN